MSRNLRYKSPQTPVKKKISRRSSRATDNSSDDDYAGVDLISDDEDSDPDVEGLEEQAIIDSEADDEDEDDDLQSTPRAQLDDDAIEWKGYELPGTGGHNETFFDEHMARMHAPDHDTEAAAWNATNSSISEDTGTPGRRVHFDLSDSDDDGGETDLDDDFFPDIFLDQNNLDPGFRRTIENDEDEDRAESDEDWDFNGSDNERTPHKNSQGQSNNHEDSDSDESTGSSGYETDSDEGLTTDEDLPPESKFAPAKSVLRRVSDASEDEEEITVTRRAPSQGPRLASWVLDRSKPFAVLDSKGKKLIMFKATAKRRVSFNGTSNVIEHRTANMFMDQSSPMISNSGNIMLGAMYTPLDQYAGAALGPPEAFHPFTDIAVDGTATHDSTSSFDDDDYADLIMDGFYNIDDFISLGDGSSDEEGPANGEDQDPSPSSDNAESFSTPARATPGRPTTATSEDQPQAHPLLNHFNNKDVVGSFRRNQTRHQQLTRNAVSTDALAFSGPYSQGILRGIKGGRLEAANTPITPMRRKKVQMPIGSSPGSPLANAASNSKRKFDGDHFGHKRSRSAI